LKTLILTRSQNIYYINGYRAAAMNWTLPILSLIIPLKGEMKFMTRLIEGTTADTQLAPVTRKYKDHEDPYEILAKMIEECGGASEKIGVEESFLTAHQLAQIKRVLPHADLKNCSGLVEAIRITLSEHEVAYFRRAAEITNIGFQRGLGSIRAGVHAYEVIAEMQNAMYKAGQSDVEVPKMWIWAGPQGGLMHDTAVTHRIDEGDLATLEVWGTDWQYLVGAQGTVYFGEKPSQEVLDEQKLVSDMYLAAKDALKPGATSGDTYRAANNVYRSARGEDYWRRVGSNMGLTFGPVDMGMTGQHVIEPWTPFILQIVEVKPALVTCCSTLLVTDTSVEELTPPLLELRHV
ncbi:MAG: M24 family metallopeptidase, partial [Desulfatiglandales bacterium]